MQKKADIQANLKASDTQILRDYKRQIHMVTVVGLAINLSLTIGKFVIGVISMSQALVADAVHSLSDMATDIAVIVGVRYWSAPADEDHPYGHGKIETFISLLIASALAAVGVGLALRAIGTLHQHHGSLPGWGAFAAALVSIISKETLYQWTARVGKKIRSTAVLANAWHHRSDALSSIPVAVAVLGSRIHPSWGFLDHIATVLVSALILHTAWLIGWTAVRHLLDAGANEEERRHIWSLAMNIEGVLGVHALRTRHIGSGLQVDIHIQVNPRLTVREGHNISGAVKERLLNEGADIVDVLIHVEPFEASSGE